MSQCLKVSMQKEPMKRMHEYRDKADPATPMCLHPRTPEKASRLFLLLLGSTLDLRRSTQSLLSVLSLLALLSAWLLNLVGESNTNQSVMGLELLQGFWGIVDESETSCLSATELSLETENVDLVLVGLVHFGELASEFILGDVGSVWVEDINDHLLSAEEGVANELARAQCYGLLTVRHVCVWKTFSP